MATVTLWPLKKRLVPLYGTGFFLVPWWPVPVQYLMKTRVQFLKLFSSLMEMTPFEVDMVSV